MPSIGVLAIMLFAACGDGTESDDTDRLCADVIDVEVDRGDAGAVSMAVTIESDDIGWEGYADRWEVLVDGVVVAQRQLLHPHVEEQPFTRSKSGIVLDSERAVVRAHHSTGGYCGRDMEVDLG